MLKKDEPLWLDHSSNTNTRNQIPMKGAASRWQTHPSALQIQTVVSLYAAERDASWNETLKRAGRGQKDRDAGQRAQEKDQATNLDRKQTVVATIVGTVAAVSCAKPGLKH